MDKSIILTVASPILLTIGGLITWFVKSKKDDLLLSEERSRDNKIKIYEELLEPFITIFTFSLSEKEKRDGINKIKSPSYRKAGFNLMTFGSDEVVRSYNIILQAFFSTKVDDFPNEEEYALRMLTYISDLLLNIRKDLYTKKTHLKRSEMLETMITDIKKHESQINSRIK